VIVLPFLGIFVYLIANGSGMAERRTKEAAASQAQLDAYVRSVEGSRDLSQIARAKDLLDQNAITQDEFDKLKADALAG
jgi:putative oligomerization/nucleic acid binding protein